MERLTSKQTLRLLLHTLPHLRWEQLCYRPWRWTQLRAYRRFPRLTARWTTSDKQPRFPPQSSLQTIRQVFLNGYTHRQPPLLQCEARLTQLLNGQFTFLERTLALPAPDWNTRYESHLWNYQLHYFDDAVLLARAQLGQREERAWRRLQFLLDSWVTQARIGSSDGWDAYPTSLRVVNWMYASSLLADEACVRRFWPRWQMAIHQQLDFLAHHLEWHLLANHLLKNIKALVIGGLYFGADQAAARWLACGKRWLWRELDEQILSDGGHYERAPMYHAQVLADFFECFALLHAFDALTPAETARVREGLTAQRHWLEALSYDDGTLARFNDSAATEETRPQPLCAAVAKFVASSAAAATLTSGKSAPRQTGSIVLAASGYFVWRSTDGREQCVADAGEPSVGYNAAHAHCDLLSYELHLAGAPLIVDAGVHGYGGDPFRAYCRATRAHNTVQFDGREQSEIWGTFRLARRARLLHAQASGDATTWKFCASYTPYYDATLQHTRTIERNAAGEWRITDTCSGGRAARAESFIHLHPTVAVTLAEAGGARYALCRTPQQLTIAIEPFGTEQLDLICGAQAPDTVQGWHFPTFGVAQAAPTLRLLTASVSAGQSFGYRVRVLPAP